MRVHAARGDGCGGKADPDHVPKRVLHRCSERRDLGARSQLLGDVGGSVRRVSESMSVADRVLPMSGAGAVGVCAPEVCSYRIGVKKYKEVRSGKDYVDDSIGSEW